LIHRIEAGGAAAKGDTLVEFVLGHEVEDLIEAGATYGNKMKMPIGGGRPRKAGAGWKLNQG